VATVAPKIKESHRLALCAELFRAPPRQRRPAGEHRRGAARAARRGAAPGRWLVFAEVAVRAGDRVPLEEARERAATGPESSRIAWTLLAWALADGEPPAVRPSVELVARLSDRRATIAIRPSCSARRRAAPAVRSLLEHLVRGAGLRGPTAVRAALYLVRDHAREDLRRELWSVAGNKQLEALRGLAYAAPRRRGGSGERRRSVGAAAPQPPAPTVTWAVLARARAQGGLTGDLVTERRFRGSSRLGRVSCAAPGASRHRARRGWRRWSAHLDIEVDGFRRR
jgi:hypothetical protein